MGLWGRPMGICGQWLPESSGGRLNPVTWSATAAEQRIQVHSALFYHPETEPDRLVGIRIPYHTGGTLRRGAARLLPAACCLPCCCVCLPAAACYAGRTIARDSTVLPVPRTTAVQLCTGTVQLATGS
jgi:hypothetical protein